MPEPSTMDTGTPERPPHVVEQEGAAAVARYEAALAAGLSEAEAQEEGWPNRGVLSVPRGYRPTSSPAFARIEVVATDTVWQATREVTDRRPDLGLSARDAAVIAHLHTRHGRDLDTMLAGAANTFDMSALYETHHQAHADTDAGLLGHSHRDLPYVEPGDGKNTLPVYEWVSDIVTERQRVEMERLRAGFKEWGHERLLDHTIAQTLAHHESAGLAWQLFCAAMGVTVDTFEGIPGALDPVHAVAARAEAGDRAVAEAQRLADRVAYLDEMLAAAVGRASELVRLDDWLSDNLPAYKPTGGPATVDAAIEVMNTCRVAVEAVVTLMRQQWAHLARSGLIDPHYVTVAMLQPDWEDAQIREEVARIRGAAPAEPTAAPADEETPK